MTNNEISTKVYPENANQQLYFLDIDADGIVNLQEGLVGHLKYISNLHLKGNLHVHSFGQARR